jgi:hypothetical protein
MDAIDAIGSAVPDCVHHAERMILSPAAHTGVVQHSA